MTEQARPTSAAPWRARLHEIVFEADTPEGRAFDVTLVVLILAAVVTAMLESVRSLPAAVHDGLVVAEWIFTALFTIEYGLRLLSVQRPLRYATSFFGVVDLLAVLPTYLSLLFPGSQSLLVIRALRLLRIFRILKLAHFLSEAQALRRALLQSRAKITVFLATVLIAVTIVGAAMYLIEGPEHGFTSVPMATYWAIVTMTTVGYGDISPGTAAGKLLASLLMVLGYSLIIVPTGIVSAEMAQQAMRRPISTQACPSCSREGHDADARHCKWCGAAL
ncbi:MAG: ion transporter [Proteobacteria bacterium]|nr:MAG: ion transporter [Pseudomonadota bacterium]